MSFTPSSPGIATEYLARFPTQPAKVANRSTNEASESFFDISETLFAGLSVLIGCLALIVGLLQLRRYHRSHLLQNEDLVFELEAGHPEV